MQDELTGRTALVTGGASGIGAAIARRWAAAGGNVLVGDVDDRAGAALADELGEAAGFVHYDVTSEADHAAAFEAALGRHGAVDAFFGNAGAVGTTGPIGETGRDAWDGTMDLLLTGAFLGVKHAVRAMRPRGRGAIVCTGSVASVRGGLGPHAYTAAKHGLLGLVESVAVEIGRYGLRINCVAPGGAVSALSAGLGGDPDDLDAAYDRLAASSSSGVPTTADDVAAAALFLAGPGAARVNGTRIVVDGGDDVPSAKGLPYYAPPFPKSGNL